MAGRHSRAAARKRKAMWLYAAVFIVAGMLAVFGVRLISNVAASCDSAEFVVEADPTIAPALTDLAENVLSEDDSEFGCLQPEIRATESGATAELLANPQQSAQIDRADVWIPDSTTWIDKARADGEQIPAGTTVATSPVVLAVTEDFASDTGWPERNPSWSELLTGVGVAGTAEPPGDAAATFALMGINGLKWSGADRTKAIQSLTKNAFKASDKPFDHLPGGEKKPTVATFPSSEQQVLQRNSTVQAGGSKSVVAAYPDTPTPWLDYPAVVLDGLPEAKRTAAKNFVKALTLPDGQRVLAKHGFRAPNGVLSGEGAADKRVHGNAGDKIPPPDWQTTTKTLQSWAAVSAAARMVYAQDVSGSMKETIPGTEFNRMQIALKTMAEALRLLRPQTELTMWEFSTERDGEKPYKELTPYKTMKDHRADGLPDQLDQLFSGPTGGTGLYDTTLAAYKRALENWDQGKLNLVLIITDGNNYYPNGLSKEKLKAELDKIVDPNKPVRVLYVGLGTEVDPGHLNELAKVSGGKAYMSANILEAREVFYTVLTDLSKPTG